MAERPERHRSAMRRTALSRPMRLAVEDGLIGVGTTVLDYGCGLGGDVRHLGAAGADAVGWDPAHAPRGDRRRSSVVNLGYVVNVIEDAAERRDTLRAAYGLSADLLVVSARLLDEAPVAGARMADGVLTRIGTFQKFFEQQELRAWIDAALDAKSIAAAPGIFYVFANEDARVRFLASRVSRGRSAVATLKPPPDRAVLSPLVDFLASHGRAPSPAELPEMLSIGRIAGGAARAVALAGELVPDLQSVRNRCADDLILLLALARFDGRPRASQMPESVLADARAFFGSYAAACQAADSALVALGERGAIARACRQAPFGKLMPTAVYVHADAIAELPLALRLYEGCARGYAGAVPGTTVVKLGIDQAKVTYLRYDEFDSEAHPSLVSSTRVHLRELSVRTRRYDGWANPPILHRKEQLLVPSDPRRAALSQLTKSEEQHGLYDDPATIGTRRGWHDALDRAGVEIKGHRLIPRAAAPSGTE